MSITTGKLNENDESKPDELDSLKQEMAELKNLISELSKQKQPLSLGVPVKQDSSDETIVKVVQAIEQAKFDKGDYYKPESLDTEDVLPEPIQFTSYGIMHLVLDDKRNGKPVLPPNTTRIGQKKFLFKPSGRVKRWRNDGEKSEMYYQHFCALTVGSVKDAEWLKSHSRFNIDFFLNINKALSTDAYKSQIASNILRGLENQPADAILRRAKEIGIPAGGDIQTLRQEIAFQTASGFVKNQEDQQKEKTKETMEKTLMSTSGK